MNEVWNYSEISEYISEDYNKLIDPNGICKFTVEEATANILDEYRDIIDKDDIEKIMIYIVIGKKSIEYGSLDNKVQKEIMKIFEKKRLDELKKDFIDEDYNTVKSDLEYLVSKINKNFIVT